MDLGSLYTRRHRFVVSRFRFPGGPKAGNGKRRLKDQPPSSSGLSSAARPADQPPKSREVNSGLSAVIGWVHFPGFSRDLDLVKGGEDGGGFSHFGFWL